MKTLQKNQELILECIGDIGEYASASEISKYLFMHKDLAIVPSNATKYVESLEKTPFFLVDKRIGFNEKTRRNGRWWELNERGVTYLEYQRCINELITKRNKLLDKTDNSSKNDGIGAFEFEFG